jgi:TRAP-type C4-dicarboxylate transport system substrate-binding protein
MSFKPALLATSILIASAVSALAETRLIFATTVPGGASINAEFLHPWADAINKAGAGIITIDTRDGPTIASGSNFYSRVQEDVVQVSWGIQNSIGGKFPQSSIAGLPSIAPSSETGSAAFWRLYKSGLLDAEYKDIVPLMLVALTQSELHLTRAPKSPTDLSGMKVASTSRLNSLVLAQLSATPISVVNSDLYQVLQRRTADAATMTWTGFPIFKLGEVTSVHLSAPLGGSTGMVFMTRAKFESLPPDARDVLLKFSGEEMSRKFGRWFDTSDKRTRDETAADSRHIIITLDAAQRQAWTTAVAPVLDKWAGEIVNGPAVLAKMRELVGELSK